MDSELLNLLRTVAVDSSNDSYSYVSLFSPVKRWNIGPHNQYEFWRTYCDLVDRKTNGRDSIPPEPLSNLCLAECHLGVVPIIAKFNFRFQTDPSSQNNNTWEPYDDYFLQHLCHIYQTVISDYFRLKSYARIELIVVVLESSTHWYDEENGHRFLNMEVQLQFPYARIDSNMYKLVRPHVIQLLRSYNVMSKMQCQPIGDWNQIISNNTISDSIVLYGSSERRDHPKLKVTHIWPFISQELLDLRSQPDEIPLEDAFEPAAHYHFMIQDVNASILKDGKNIEYWLPLFLSVYYMPSLLLPKDNTNNKSLSLPEIGIKDRIHENNEMDMSDMELSERMISMINVNRFNREAYWLNIGKALYRSDRGGENGLLSWIIHTKRSLTGTGNIPEFMETAGNIIDTCSELYYTFIDSSITVKTLACYAREDSPDIYADWHREWYMAGMEQALSCYHTDVANAFYRVYWLDYVYCFIGKGTWFKFSYDRWRKIPQAIDIHKTLSNDFMKKIKSRGLILDRQIRDSNDEAFKEKAKITLKKLINIAGKLKTYPFKYYIVKEARELFLNDRFANLLDNNPDLTGVTNGVI